MTTTHFTAAVAVAAAAATSGGAAAEKFKHPYDCRVRRPSRVRVMLRLVTVVIVDYKKRPKTINDLTRDSSKVCKLNQTINILKQDSNDFKPSGASMVQF